MSYPQKTASLITIIRNINIIILVKLYLYFILYIVKLYIVKLYSLAFLH